MLVVCRKVVNEVDNEIGETLETVLKYFWRKSATIEEFSYVTSIDAPRVASLFNSLRNRNFLACYRNAIELKPGEPPGLSDRFCITEEGRSYLEVQKRIWKRFRIGSIYVPFGVALLTSIIANIVAIWLNSGGTP